MSARLRYSATVSFDVDANRPGDVADKLGELATLGTVSNVKAKSIGEKDELAPTTVKAS